VTYFTHTQNYKWNEDIGGSYRLINESVYFKNKKKSWRKKLALKMSDLIFQGRKIIIIKEKISYGGDSHIYSFDFNYTKKATQFKIKNNNLKLSQLIQNDLDIFKKNKKLIQSKTSYQNFYCLRKKKLTLTCHVHGLIKERLEKVTSK